jgi:hypothetical protein
VGGGKNLPLKYIFSVLSVYRIIPQSPAPRPCFCLLAFQQLVAYSVVHLCLASLWIQISACLPLVLILDVETKLRDKENIRMGAILFV